VAADGRCSDHELWPNRLCCCLALQTDGKIVAAGNSLNVTTSTDAFAVARYTAQ